MAPIQYPLQQLVEIKQNRFDQAVKALEQKKALLAKEEEKLKAVTQERDEVKEHKSAKLEQLREALDTGTSTDKIQQMKIYLKVVDERLAEKEKRVREQAAQVKAAEKQVEIATQEMFQRKKDVEKLEMHRKEWEKEVAYLIEQKEGHVQDEQGTASYIMKKRKERSP